MAKSNMKTIKRRIKSVGSTMQITKAMEMVASSKLRKAKLHAEAARPYFETQYELLSEIAGENDDFKTIFTEAREVKNSLFIVIAGDRGLAGGYNSNILKLAVSEQIKIGTAKPKIISIGKKAVEFFDKRDYEVIARYPNFAENVKVGSCSDIANIAVELFKSGDVDEVKIFYTSYVSAIQQCPSQLKLLPLETYKNETGTTRRLTSYDPSPEAVFNRIIPKFILSVVHCACVESFASEQCARRTAMENASDNAEEMTEKLSLQYNRARQEKITNEINEIVAGANAI